MVNKLQKKIGEGVEHIKRDQSKAAHQTMMEELFQDMYKNRGQVYKMNFIRGILFGIGSAIGGTLVIALLIWVLSLFVNFPLVGEYFKDAQQTIEQSRSSE